VHHLAYIALVCVYFFVGVNSQANCGAACQGDHNCTGNPLCTSCRLGICVGLGNCGSYCNPNQDINLWCYNSYCTTCDRISSTCLSDCGAPCTVPTQCMSHCNFCTVSFRCVRSCGSTCVADSDCAPNVDGCTKCTNSTCQKPTGCAAFCISNSDCINNKDGCTKCVRNQCVKGGCGSICYYSPDCIGQGNCSQCYGRFSPGGYGLCTGSCNSPCNDPEQCNGTLTNCGQCRNNVCSPSTQCGITCENSAGCAGSCSRCIAGLCTKSAACGESCTVNTDCDPVSPCPYCTNTVCSGPGVGVNIL